MVTGMALGGGDGLSEPASTAMRNAGLGHRRAGSGQNGAGSGSGGRAARGARGGARIVYCIQYTELGDRFDVLPVRPVQ